jgi:hypothetical protein
MMGLLVPNPGPFEPRQPSPPLLPAFVRRVLMAWFGRR